MRLRLVLVIVSLSFALHAQTRSAQERSVPERSVQEKEVALGAQLASQVDRTSAPLGIARVDLFIGNLGNRLAAQMPNAQESWKFKVVTNLKSGPTYEPVSLPGGWVYIPAQLLVRVNNEAELAGMLAHAMAHVAQRDNLHWTRASSDQPAAIPLIFTGTSMGRDDEAMVPRGNLEAHRRQEMVADQIAAGAMAGAGFDPQSLVDYIRRMTPASPRIGNLQSSVETSPAAGPYVVSTDLFQSIQEEVRRALASR